MFKRTSDHSIGRSRWAAFGAAVAVSLGAGGAGWIAHAGPAPTPNTFVPISQCRLLDTRTASPVGPKHTPLGAAKTYSAAVRGTNGHCTIPSSATAVVVNVTALNATAASRLTVWGSGTRPGGATMAWAAHSLPVSNGVTTGLSSNGKLSFYNAAGTVNLTVDIRGYYLPVAVGPTVYSKYLSGGVDSTLGEGIITSFVVPAGTYMVTAKLYGLADANAGVHSLLCYTLDDITEIDFTHVTSGAGEYRHVSMQGVVTAAAPSTIKLACNTSAVAEFQMYGMSLVAVRVTAGN
jgi:hypothetical protein